MTVLVAAVAAAGGGCDGDSRLLSSKRACLEGGIISGLQCSVWIMGHELIL